MASVNFFARFWAPAVTAEAQNPAIVLMGDAGSGKSRVVELLKDLTEGTISSHNLHSATKSSLVYRTLEFDIIDTPGANGRQNTIHEHNLWIAQAFNCCPLSMIGIVAKAETRVDTVIEVLRKYLARLQDFESILCPIITHMDLVVWTREDLLQALEQEFGKKFRKAVFSRKDPKFTKNMLSQQILQQCAQRPVKVNIRSENFLKYFRVESNDLSTLQFIEEEVDRYRQFVKTVTEKLSSYHPKRKQADLVFEAMNFVHDQIAPCEQRLIVSRLFKFDGLDDATAALQYGHCAALRNQISELLLELRTISARYYSETDCDLRSCPHCGRVWNLIEGCKGATTCGESVSNGNDVRDGCDRYATFSFPLDPVTGLYGIREGDGKQIIRPTPRVGKVGCGKVIYWDKMTPCPVPPEWKQALKPNVQDVPTLGASLLTTFGDLFRRATAAMRIQVVE